MAGDPTAAVLTGTLTEVANFIAAAGGLGTAAMGLVDATKSFFGGPSNFGFADIKRELTPFLAPLGASGNAFSEAGVLRTLKANWLNGVAKADQKAKAKSLIHLGLTKGSAGALAAAAGVDQTKLVSLANKTASGGQVTQDEISVLGQFDAVLSAVLDAAYERGDQKYRNACKFLSMAVATVMAVAGGRIAFGDLSGGHLALSLLVGISATPLAPVAKDLASTLQSAVTTVSALKR
jgi:hypothetical protein